MNDTHLRRLELRRAAFYRGVQFISAVALNAFLLMTLDDPDLLGGRHSVSFVGAGVVAVFSLLGLTGFLLANRGRNAGFWFYAAAYFSMVPWFVLAFRRDWLMSLIGIMINGTIGATLLWRARQRALKRLPVQHMRAELFGAWGPSLLWLNSVAVITGVLEAGFRETVITAGIVLALLLVFGSLLVSCVLEWRHRRPSLRTGPHLEWLLLVVLACVAVFGRHGMAHLDAATLFNRYWTALVTLAAFRQFIVLSRHFLRTRYAWRLSRYFFRRPAQLTALSFATVILTGSLWLSFPHMSQTGTPIRFADALFTSTSAVCVTGLVTLDTPKAFTFLGQMVIMILIQIGGLGIVTLSTFAAIILGKNIGLGQEFTLDRMIGDSSVRNVVRLVKFICIATLAIEAAGAALLLPQFLSNGFGWRTSLWKAVFHAISAFNNAGFALQSDNLVSFNRQPGILMTVSTLIVCGGLGFGVLHWLWLRLHGNRMRLNLHIAAVLLGTALLLVAGAAIFFATEYNHAFAGMSLVDRMANAWFQSVTPRTAGFNTVDMEALHPLNRFVTIILMFIGVAPGSTGGGVKITTIFVMLLAVRAVMRGEDEVHGLGYSLDTATVFRAGSILMLCLTSCVVCLAVLLATQPCNDVTKFTTEKLMFETVSAFGTVGLSMNVSPSLNGIGKIAIVALMYVGRVGALTLVLSLRRLIRPGIRYPRADIMLG